MSKFDISIPRRMFWGSEVGSNQVCPKCGAPLENEFQGYLVGIRDKTQVDSFIVHNDGGYFCPNCPVVVLDDRSFDDALSAIDMGGRFSGSAEFIVAGIVDLDAIPEEKADVPLGTDDNPLPLVEFLGDSTEAKVSKNRASTARKRRSKKGKRKRSKKKRRP